MDHLRRLVLAEHAVVHEDRGRPLSHGALEQGGDHRRVDAAGEGADHLPLPHPLPDGGHRLVEVGGHPPVAAGAADAEEEVAQYLAARDGVRDLGVELDAVEPALGVLEADHRRVLRGGGPPEAGGEIADAVAVAHPYGLAGGEPLEQAPGLDDRHLGAAVLAMGGALDAAAQLVGHHLHAVADPQHRHAEREQLGRRGGRSLLVDALRAAREDDADGAAAADLRDRQIERVDLAVDPVLAHPAGDELGELAAEIQDENGLARGRFWILDFGFWIQSVLGFAHGSISPLSIQNPKSKIQNGQSSVSDFSSRVISSSTAWRGSFP